MGTRAVAFAMLLAGATAWSRASAQPAGARADPEQEQDAPYTLQVNSRVVLTDVTVTDRHGNPVTGLTEDDFRIFDNGHQQKLGSFEEHREQRAALKEAAAPAGSFNNDVLRHPPPQVNAILFDTTTIEMLDQMVLFQQMTKFVAGLPAGEPVAVFVRSADVTFELSRFTDDHATLMAAIGRAIPKFQRPGTRMASDLDTLEQMAMYLSQVPGRKNLIWFTGGSNLYLNVSPESGGLNSVLGAEANDSQRRSIYDLLESERIAIYPIDARGLTVALSNPFQQMQMRQDAAATGGEAYMNTNGLALAAQHIVATDGDYYTLTYSPQDLKNDGKWHRVEVKLERADDQLSYRQGYFDDGSNEPGPPGKTRTVLKAGVGKVEVPNDQSEPIVFSIKVVPAPAGLAVAASDPPVKRDATRYIVQFVVPAKDVVPENISGNTATDVLDSAVLAFDGQGEPVAKRLLKVTLRVDEVKRRSISDPTVAFYETVNLPKGRNYLYVAVWDTMTGRTGIVNGAVDMGKKR